MMLKIISINYFSRRYRISIFLDFKLIHYKSVTIVPRKRKLEIYEE